MNDCIHRWEVVGTTATCMDCFAIQPKREGCVIGPQWMQKTIAIDHTGNTKAAPPVLGAKAVYFLTDGHYGLLWKHKGWLMPSVQ